MRRTATARLLFLALLLESVGSGCAWLRQLGAGGVQAPSLTFVRATPESISGAGIELAVVVRVDNPNELAVPVSGARYTLELAGRPIASGQLARAIELPPRGATEVRLPLSLRFAELAPVVEQLRRSRTLRYRAAGVVILQTPIGERELAFAHEDALALPALPTVTLTRLSLAAAEGGKVTLQLVLRLENPNDVPLPLGGLTGALALDGARLAEVSAPGGELAAHGSRELTVPLTVELAKAGRLARRLLLGGEGKLALEGALDVGGLQVPLDAAAALPVERR